MASQVGNVPRDGMCTERSTKCANGGVAMDGAKAWESTGKGTEDGGIGHGGLCASPKCGSGDQHACRLHAIRDVRKSVFTLRIRVFTGLEGPVCLSDRALCARLSCVIALTTCDAISLRMKVVRKATAGWWASWRAKLRAARSRPFYNPASASRK